MSLVEWLLIALVFAAVVALVLLYFCLEFIAQIRDMMNGLTRLYGDRPSSSTEHTQKEVLRVLEYLEVVVRNWRDGR